MDESNLRRPKGLVASVIRRAKKQRLQEQLLSGALISSLHGTTPEERELADELIDVLEVQKQAKNATPTLPSVLQPSRNLRPDIDRIDTSSSADWQRLHGKFAKLMDEEEAAYRDRRSDVWLYGWYLARKHQADCHYQYRVHGDGMGTEFRERFSALAIEAGKLKGAPRDLDPLGYWLKSLYEAVNENKASSRHGSFIFGGDGGCFIRYVCEASAWYCKRLEAEALKVEHNAGISIGSEAALQRQAEGSRQILRSTTRKLAISKRSNAEATGVRRARVVAKLINELNTLRPLMQVPDDDFPKLSKDNPNYQVFKICKRHPSASNWVRLLPDRRSVHSLAYKIAAVECSCSAATIETAWKRYKNKIRTKDR